MMSRVETPGLNDDEEQVRVCRADNEEQVAQGKHWEAKEHIKNKESTKNTNKIKQKLKISGTRRSIKK